MANSQLRLLRIVSLLPKHPNQKSAKSLQNVLAQMGHDVDIRTLQRDLQTLVEESGLGIEQTRPTGRGKEGVGYCFKKGAKTLGPKMEYPTALTLVMANEYIAKLMPDEVSQAMEPFIAQAEASLGQDHKKVHAGWKDKIRSVPRYMCFEKPIIQPGIHGAVTEALLQDRCIEITYKSRLEPYMLHPLALVDRGLETILVAYVEEYKEHRQFMLHRIRTVRTTTFSVKRPPDFDIDELILHGYFSVPVENSQLEPIELKLRLLEQPDISSARLDIMGTPLSKDQKIEVSEDESSSIVTATVRDTQELRSWILGLGARAEVIEPAYLRQFVAHTIGLLNEKYSA